MAIGWGHVIITLNVNVPSDGHVFLEVTCYLLSQGHHLSFFLGLCICIYIN
jgi:hypothetical protein